jgi:hypothetical protein
MSTSGHPRSDARHRRRVTSTGVGPRIRRRFTAALTLGAILVPTVADASPADGRVAADGSDVVVAPIDEESIFDDLTLTEVIDALADDDFKFDGRNIVVEDPAPMGPFIDGVASGTADSTAGPAASGAGSEGPVAVTGIDEAFSLNSRPGATRTIYLDFDGQTVSGTSWNSSVATIRAGRYRREPAGNPDNGFTQLELNGIFEIWERVAEDFAAWDVNVTTEDPGVDALMQSGTDDDEYGIRTIITPDYEWYSSQPLGGVAYLRSFSRSADLAAWVFSSNLGTGNPKSVAEAVSHEVGHTLGLRHDGYDDGFSSTSYYAGHGSWAPIMGVGYYRDVTHWSNGGYPGATNVEDDLAIIDGFIDRLPTNAGGGSSELPNSGTSTTVHVLRESGATASHTLQVTRGPVTIELEKSDASGNVLAALTVRNEAGQVVDSASPIHPAAWLLSVALPADVAPGSYTVEVRSVGWTGNGSSDPGFSPYGSIGGYSLTVEMPGSGGTTTDPPPVGPTTRPPSGGGDGERLQSISPLRVLDTRSASSPISGRLRAGQNLRLDLPTAPAGTNAAVVNIVAADPSGTGWLSITPCTPLASSERTSSINFARGRSIANSIVAPMTADGELCVYASTATHVVVDVTGWIGPSGSLTLDEVGSTRVIDTREGLGIPRRLRAGTTTEVDLSDALSGEDIGAIALALTAIRPTARGYITIDDCTSNDTTSSLNVAARENRSNNGIFALGSGQRLCISTTTTTHITIDITGEFGTGSGLRFVAATPARVLDTRDSRALPPGSSTSFQLPAATIANGFSVAPAAASVNLTAARPESSGFVTAWDCGPRPETSVLNAAADTSTASGALIPMSRAGQTCLFHSKGGHLIVDLAGWWI